MNEPMSRVLLYGSAVVVIAGIAIAWSNTSTDADVMTLLSSADSQLRMAHAIPPVDLQGKRLETRDDMIVHAIDQLVKVERIEPGMACTAEFRGFAHMLQGEFSEAAACYQDASTRQDCEDEQRDILAFNQARMWVQAGSGERALEVFAANKSTLDARYGHQRRLEEAAILRSLGRTTEAFTRLQVVTNDASASPMARLQAGREYTELGDFAAGENALKGIQNEIPIADYYLAQLKLRQGQTDISIELLERVSKARPTEVRRMLRKEADAWSAVAEDARFQKLSKLLPASPGR
ncbi:MAG: tetratricopeptide (TPR) repeat protein [Planctomycetota bacterium]|jgi:tetratricopeptide (TPR) repeat protein